MLNSTNTTTTHTNRPYQAKLSNVGLWTYAGRVLAGYVTCERGVPKWAPCTSNRYVRNSAKRELTLIAVEPFRSLKEPPIQCSTKAAGPIDGPSLEAKSPLHVRR